MEQYCMYLRKSRADAEAEERGEGETLARHERILIELSKKLNLNVTQIYREIVSGETIAARPVAQRLLSEVERGIWTGVLVMEVERLARGDTIDQGIMAQTFKYSDTKIITPMKTYDPNNEFDEEYFEFGLFMSRREYKTINRRLQRGRLAAVKEGKYVANKTPYGYNRIRLEKEKGWTLEINEEQADIIRLIFTLYAFGEKQSDGSYKHLGVSLITRRLNEMKAPTKMGGNWTVGTVRDILINPVYTGKIRWNWRPSVKQMVNGQVTISTPRNKTDNCIIADGMHPAIISNDLFGRVQEIMKKNPPAPIGRKNTTQNPLAGIVICSECGRRMQRRPYQAKRQSDSLICADTSCKNVSSYLSVVEERILSSLHEWLENYKLNWTVSPMDNKTAVSSADMKRRSLKKAQEELKTLSQQISKTHDLLEQGVYTIEIFLERNRILSEKADRIKSDISSLEADLKNETLRKEAAVTIIPKIEHLLEVYHDLPSPKAKNDLLKEVLEKVVYKKAKSTRWHGSQDDFEIILYPKIPKESLL